MVHDMKRESCIGVSVGTALSSCIRKTQKLQAASRAELLHGHGLTTLANCNPFMAAKPYNVIAS